MAISEYLKMLRQKIGNEILQIPSVAAVIRNSDGKFLFVKNAEDGIWGLPAGAIELGETPAAAVVREVSEETGLDVEPLELIGVFGGEKFRHVYPNGDKVEYFIVVFKCKIKGGELAAQDGEVSELKYFGAEEMPELMFPYSKEIFTDF